MATSAVVSQFAISGSELQERRERVFLVLAGFFLCAMTLLNVIGITRFVQIGPMSLAVGVLAYPLTFLCTDLISELYGRKRANFLVTVGLVLNIFIILIMSLANYLPDSTTQPPWQVIELANSISLPNGEVVEQSVELFSLIYACTAGAVAASMLAYIIAQYIDVYLFHKIKQMTNGKHLWLRNNGSTMVSQLVDSATVITVTFGAAILAGDMGLKAFFVLLLSNYFFKLIAALMDTPIIYLLVNRLRSYLQIESNNSQTPYKQRK